MKWFVLLITIAIWQCVNKQVTGNPVNVRKSRHLINPMMPLAYPFSPYLGAEQVNPFLPYYTGFVKATKEKQEHATTVKSNDEEDKSTSQVQKREINEPELTKSKNNNKDKKEDKKDVKNKHTDVIWYDMLWPKWPFFF